MTRSQSINSACEGSRVVMVGVGLISPDANGFRGSATQSQATAWVGEGLGQVCRSARSQGNRPTTPALFTANTRRLDKGWVTGRQL
jgi:hypothetical protein